MARREKEVRLFHFLSRTSFQEQVGAYGRVHAIDKKEYP